MARKVKDTVGLAVAVGMAVATAEVLPSDEEIIRLADEEIAKLTSRVADLGSTKENARERLKGRRHAKILEHAAVLMEFVEHRYKCPAIVGGSDGSETCPRCRLSRAVRTGYIDADNTWTVTLEITGDDL